VIPCMPQELFILARLVAGTRRILHACKRMCACRASGFSCGLTEPHAGLLHAQLYFSACNACGPGLYCYRFVFQTLPGLEAEVLLIERRGDDETITDRTDDAAAQDICSTKGVMVGECVDRPSRTFPKEGHLFLVAVMDEQGTHAGTNYQVVFFTD